MKSGRKLLKAYLSQCESGFMSLCVWVLSGWRGGGGWTSSQSLHHIEGWIQSPESSEGHRFICILAQRRPPGDPERRWDRVERLAAFRGSSPPVQGERESAAPLIASAGGEEGRKDKTEVKTLAREKPLRRGKRGGGGGKRSQCLKLDINDRLEVWEGCVFVFQRWVLCWALHR